MRPSFKSGMITNTTSEFPDKQCYLRGELGGGQVPSNWINGQECQGWSS